MKYFAADDILYSNNNTISNEINDNFLIIKGSANVYKREVNDDGQFVNVFKYYLELFKNIDRGKWIRWSYVKWIEIVWEEWKCKYSYNIKQ